MVNRTQTADLLKGVAALLMIQVHIIELFATQNIFDSNIGKVLLFLGGPPVAPVFVLIFGYFIAASEKSAIQLITRGVKIILLGLFLNIALNLNLIISVNRGIYNIDIWPYIFGIDILPLAGISIIIIAVLKKIMDKGLIAIVVLIVISAFLGKYLLNYIPQSPVLKYMFSPFYGASPWSYFPLFPWLAYPLAGIAFYKIKQHPFFYLLNSTKAKIISGILFLLFLVFTIRYSISISSSVTAGLCLNPFQSQRYYHHGLIFFLWVIIFLSFYSFFINEIEKKLGTTIVFRYIKWLGKNITVIYVIQWVIIGNIATEIFKTVSSPSYLIFCFIAVLMVASGICYLWIKYLSPALFKGMGEPMHKGNNKQ